MKTENWIQIAIGIATIIAMVIQPFLTKWIASRTDQPIQIPDNVKLKNRIQRIGSSLIRFCNSPWGMPLFIIVSNMYFLLHYLHFIHDVPLVWVMTKYAVLPICIDVGLVLTGIGYMGFLYLIRFIQNEIEYVLKTIESERKYNLKMDDHEHEMIKDIVDEISRIESQIHELMTKNIVDEISRIESEIHELKTNLPKPTES